jgi:hypothetical protein
MSQANNEARDLAKAMFSLAGLSVEEKNEASNLADMIRTMGHMPDNYRAAWLRQHGEHLADLTRMVGAIIDDHSAEVAGRLRRFMGAELEVSFP